jgi:hypothetical protein
MGLHFPSKAERGFHNLSIGADPLNFGLKFLPPWRLSTGPCRRIRLAIRVYTSIMDIPVTRYAERDGLLIAHQVFGSGPTDLILSLGLAANCDHMWDVPKTKQAMECLATYFWIRCLPGRTGPMTC